MMPYRYYHRRLRNQDRNHVETLRLRTTFQNLEMPVKDRKCSSENQILKINSLNCFVEEVDTLDISEGQLMVFLCHLLTKISGDKYHATANRALELPVV